MTGDTAPIPDLVAVPAPIAGYVSGVANKSSKRKAGKQPGAKGFGRKQKLAVTENSGRYLLESKRPYNINIHFGTYA